MNFKRSFFALVCVLGMGAASAQAQFWNLQASLDGLQEVPPNASPATGFCTIQVNQASNLVDVACTYQGFIGTPTVTHLHLGAPGVNGPTFVNLAYGINGPGTAGVVGGGPLTPVQLSAMLTGNTYVNLHTTSFPGGEIRGQITPEPASLTLLALGGLAALRRRR